MDPAMDLVYLKKLVMTTQIHYQNPHREAMMFKRLWTSDKTPSIERETEMSSNLFEEALKLVQNPNEHATEKALAIIKKGLHINPRCHRLYALRGEIYAKKRDWQKAIKWFEIAKIMTKFDKISNDETTAANYNEKLRNSYRGRGEWHENNGRLIEAAADYEQILALHPKQNQLFEFQDMLLRCLRKLDKYEAYCLAWSEFMKHAGPQRIADLMTQHAEFKIHLREVSAARRMLRKAVFLDKKNTDAQDLLQVIFDTGHKMLTYAIIWCINGCYDKALMTIDKGSDCDPYNPGFTVMKTIILRLSGRLKEAMEWLESVNKSFYKLLEPSLNKRGSVMGNLTVDKTKELLINQWYMIRYDMAIEHAIKGRYEAALNVLRSEKLLKKCVESRILMGDCFMHQGRLAAALKSYLQAHEDSVATGCWESSEKRHLIAQRIVEILNSQSREAIQIKQTEKASRKAESTITVLRQQKIQLTKLGSQRSEALMYTARSRYQESKIKRTNPCLKALADSLSFGRGVDDGGIRNAVLGDNSNLENAITCFGSKNKFPYCTKILMQN